MSLRKWQDRTGQDRTGQGRAGQGKEGRAGQGRARQGRARKGGQGRAGQGRTGQGGRAGQGRAGQGWTPPSRPGLFCVPVTQYRPVTSSHRSIAGYPSALVSSGQSPAPYQQTALSRAEPSPPRACRSPRYAHGKHQNRPDQ